MKKYTLMIFLAIFSLLSAIAQDAEKEFFDVSGKKANESQAYYYRVLESKPSHYKSYYMSGKLYFEGDITTVDTLSESKNIFSGNCIWYYKNGNKKVERNYNADGKEDGTTFYYLESGKIWKEIEYKNGSIANGKYREFSENGDLVNVFDETFDKNINDWDLYASEASSSKIENGQFEIKSLTKDGTSRTISLPISSDDYIIEAILDNSEAKGNRVGILWGFKDWQNYNYLAISESFFYVGSVYEGVQLTKIDGMFSSELVKKGKNTIKLFVNDNKLIITFNGILQTKTAELKMLGSHMGFVVGGIATLKVDNLQIKEFSGSGNISTSSSDLAVKSTGSGFLVSSNGYIVTNHHVVKNNNKIFVDVSVNGETKMYEASVVQKDEQNDLAIIKIKDTTFNVGKLKYSFSESGAVNIGAPVFTIGFPLALNGMGKDAKFTDGKVSAKTGYNGAINSFQTTIPIQPGNSGSPIFNEKGQLIGVAYAGIKNADNVSYAVKLNYLKALFDLISDVQMPNENTIESLALEDKIKVLTKYVVLIKIK